MPEEIIRPHGSYTYPDKDGFLQNPCSIDKIQPLWRKPVEEVVNKITEVFDVHSGYLRGSAAKGQAVEGISDIDFIFALNNKEFDRMNLKTFYKEIVKKYPFITGVDIALHSTEKLFNPVSSRNGEKFLIKCASCCVYGEDIARTIAPYKIGSELVIHAFGVRNYLNRTSKRLESGDEDIREVISSVMKRMLRTGFELVMEREQRYTRDLYPCYKSFAKYYPQQDKNMYEALRQALFGNNVQEALELMGTLGNWLQKETENQFAEYI